LAILIFAEKRVSAVPSFYKWRAKYGGMDDSMMSRMKELEEEHRRLKKMYLDEKFKAGIVTEALKIKW
jgi:putative transposase